MITYIWRLSLFFLVLSDQIYVALLNVVNYKVVYLWKYPGGENKTQTCA